jgi:hypothetical protein
MKAAAPASASPTAVALELRQMTIEAGGLNVGLEKANLQLARLTARLKVLTGLVEKQKNHINGLRGTKGAPPVISLPDYNEMRLRMSRNKVALADAKELIRTTTKSIDESKARLKVLEENLKARQAVLDSYGKVLPFKRTP